MSTLVEQHLVTQKITSAGTSVNQLPAVLRLLKKVYDPKDWQGARFWVDTKTVLDYGGGKYDQLTDAFAELGIVNLVYDPFNRSEDHNALVLKILRARKADVGICSNVLNVIREPAARTETLEHLQIGVKEGGNIFITIHEGDKTSKGKKTSKGWQANRPARNYMREIRRVFPNSFGTRWGSKALIIIENWPQKLADWPRIRGD
jgi:hypothetical protein